MRAMRGGRTLLRVARRAHRFVALSREGVAEAMRFGIPRERVALIPNAALLPGPRPGSRDDARAGVLFVGALHRRKGVDTLLEAFARIPPRSTLCLVGDGPERAALEARARTLGIADRVRFLGEVPDPSPWYAAARVFVLPSWAEGLSNALLEAMSAGLPVIATRIGGNVDVVEDGITGLLVEPGRAAELAAALERLLRDDGLAQQLGAGARAAVRAEHTLERAAERYVQLYRATLAPPGPRR
jgi:glycosyltransferase involved in cell wall biosynthesis